MAIDWDALVLTPTMGIFGEGDALQSASLPVYTPKGGAPFALPDAVFDRAYADVEVDGDGGANTTRKPCLGVRLAHFDQRGIEPGQNDMVFISSVPGRFMVKDYRPDGHGHARLILMGPM